MQPHPFTSAASVAASGSLETLGSQAGRGRPGQAGVLQESVRIQITRRRNVAARGAAPPPEKCLLEITHIKEPRLAGEGSAADEIEQAAPSGTQQSSFESSATSASTVNTRKHARVSITGEELDVIPACVRVIPGIAEIPGHPLLFTSTLCVCVSGSGWAARSRPVICTAGSPHAIHRQRNRDWHVPRPAPPHLTSRHADTLLGSQVEQRSVALRGSSVSWSGCKAL